MGKFVGLLLIALFAFTFGEECEPTQVFHETGGSLCRKTCASLDSFRCYGATQGCYCNDDHVRVEGTGECVLPENCPEEISCGENEVLADCFDPCPASCQYRLPPACLQLKCVKACNCKPGYIRNDKTDECILEDSCPNFLA